MAKILIVDDSSSMRQMIKFTLKEAGHDVYEAVDGNDGLEKAISINPDLIITDVNMPKLCGIDMCIELRNVSKLRFTPIIILTTESGDAMKAEGKAAGATGWLTKPFAPARLLDIIKRVIR